MVVVAIWMDAQFFYVAQEKNISDAKRSVTQNTSNLNITLFHSDATANALLNRQIISIPKHSGKPVVLEN